MLRVLPFLASVMQPGARLHSDTPFCPGASRGIQARVGHAMRIPLARARAIIRDCAGPNAPFGEALVSVAADGTLVPSEDGAISEDSMWFDMPEARDESAPALVALPPGVLLSRTAGVRGPRDPVAQNLLRCSDCRSLISELASALYHCLAAALSPFRAIRAMGFPSKQSPEPAAPSGGRN